MKNWKTTVAGIFLGAVHILTPTISTGNVSLIDILKGIGIAALGLFAKDFNVSGKQ